LNSVITIKNNSSEAITATHYVIPASGESTTATPFGILASGESTTAIPDGIPASGESTTAIPDGIPASGKMILATLNWYCSCSFKDKTLTKKLTKKPDPAVWKPAEFL
jgi:uncharacterized protein RhaS with RHS repeats